MIDFPQMVSVSHRNAKMYASLFFVHFSIISTIVALVKVLSIGRSDQVLAVNHIVRYWYNLQIFYYLMQ